MSECQYSESVRYPCKHHLVRKRMYRHLANRGVVFKARHSSTNLRKLLDQRKCPSRFRDEPVCHTRISIAIPARRVPQLGLGERQDRYWLQRPSTSRSTRSRTDRQSVLSSSPARAA